MLFECLSLRGQGHPPAPLAAKDEAGELRFNPQSPWTCATNQGRAFYWRNIATGGCETTLQAPAEGVTNLQEEADEEFDEEWSELA